MSQTVAEYQLDIGGHTFIAARVHGREGVSQTSRFEVRLSEAAALDPAALVHQTATLRLYRDNTERAIEALVTDIRVGAEGDGSRHAIVVLEPTLALARLRQDIRVFRNKTAPEVIVEVLAHFGIAPELRLQGSYPLHPYLVQFRETDFEFVSRLMEHEGIFYFFINGDSLVLADNTSAWDGSITLPFRAASALDMHGDAVTAFGRGGKLGAGKVTLGDFNPETPSLDMLVSAAGPWADGPEHYDFPGEFLEPGAGQRYANVLAEAFACRAATAQGRSFCMRLFAGARMALEDAPHGLDDTYAILSLEHAWNQEEEGFDIAFTALPAGVPFRAPPDTAEPVLPNPVTGIVTGPPGADIHCDEYGRVKVHFHWDRLQPKDDDCSHWIPVMQDNTGSSCSIPRVGWEVLVHFLEGDPDRPVVLGRVFNEGDPHHLVLPEMKTRSQIKSLSSPRDIHRDSSGSNEIVFEDFAGREFINVVAEKDQNVLVGNNKVEHVMVSETSMIDNDETITIGNDETVTAGDDILPIVRQNQAMSVGGNASYKVGSSQSVAVDGDRSVTIGGAHNRRIGTFCSCSADILNELVGGVILEASMQGNSWTGTMLGMLGVGGAIVEIAKGAKNANYGLARTELVGGIVFVNAKGEIQIRSDKKRMTTVGGLLMTKSDKELTIVAEDKVSLSSLNGSFAATKDMTFTVGESTVVLQGSTIQMNTKTKVSLKIKGDNQQNAAQANLIEG